jgi:hypothetical protein
MFGRVLTGGTPDSAVAIRITLTCNQSSVYDANTLQREIGVRTIEWAKTCEAFGAG